MPGASPVRPHPRHRSIGRCYGLLLLFTAGLCLPSGASAAHPWIKSYTDSTSCTRCHDEAAGEVMKSIHWTWEHLDSKTGRKLGKRHVINNFCIAVPSNEPRCTSCHVGVGYKDKNFDFSDHTKVDCLVCHDTTGTYKKFPTLAGAPWTGPGTTNFGGATWDPVDLTYVAQNVGKTSRATCGACHFYGGGGDSVKHGDLDSTLFNPDRNLDVHMAVNGANFSCSRCHPASSHQIPGTIYSQDTADHTTCVRCHSNLPHQASTALGDRLNQHTSRVACQTCHIPEFARGQTTKMFWDWSTAGKKGADGKNMVINDANGDPIYDTQKGDFTWEKDVQPDYVWFNGEVTFASLEDVVEPGKLLTINRLHGSRDDSRAYVYPVKRFRGRQPYDAGRNTLAVPHLFGSDTNAYWRSFNWTNALQAGMAYVGQPFSGEVGFVDTEMFWIQNHMVAPKEKSLNCNHCHEPQGRLQFAQLGYPSDQAAKMQTLAQLNVTGSRLGSGRPSLELRWQALPRFRHQVQQSSDLKQWTDVAGGGFPAKADLASLKWQEETAAAATTTRFYRVMRIQE